MHLVMVMGGVTSSSDAGETMGQEDLVREARSWII